MISLLFSKIFGTKNERYLKRRKSMIHAINSLEPEMEKLKDEDFAVRIAEYKEAVKNGQEIDSLRVEVFALVREASKRVLGMRHFDQQLIGGLVLNDGKIAEMRTGEGKTLVATLPVVLNAISGKGVHVITVNDYLARRDAEWMGQLYTFLGLSFGVIVHGLTDEERKIAYGADITYGTNNEFGFDYLRDNMKFYPEQLVQRGHNFAIVDEVDSILIDEARTPLIISGSSDESTELYANADAVIPRLRIDEHFTLDEKSKNAMLTDAGVSRAEEILGVGNLFDTANVTLQHHVLQSLKAHHIFKRDVDYIVKDGQVVIVDEFTGRLMPGRRFSDGLHQALEAKERVKVEAENQTLASITFQNYFRLYTKLSGMTGTADTEAVEFYEIYGLEVIAIPTHRPMVRKDHPDLVFRTKKEKYDAIAKAIKDYHDKGQPVLVGTISIEISEMLSKHLTAMGVPHNVLNAKQHDKEATIVTDAGQKGHVTIATNMAGRGTDIKLGDGVREIGGLHILGTERHESRRIDNQLRGRAGRQGDPGSSRFYLSLEDDLMRLFGADRHMKLMETLGLKDGESIEHPLISRGIQSAQKRVEAHNFEIRKTLLDYDNVMNQQREVIYSLRREAMTSDDLEGMVTEFIDDVISGEFSGINFADSSLTEEEVEITQARLNEIFNLRRKWPNGHPEEKSLPSEDDTKEAVFEMLKDLKESSPSLFTPVMRYLLLGSLDRCWKEHLLAMDQLRDGIGLRGYGQKDPKQEYKREGFNMFREMLTQIKENVCRDVTHVKIQPQPTQDGEIDEAEQEKAEALEQKKKLEQLKHKESQKLNYSGIRQPARPSTVKNDTPKIGRNDLCPCGSGNKHKKCCGKDA